MSRTHHHGLISYKPWQKRPAGYSWCSQTPGWWVRLFMNRPKRAAIHRLERKILLGVLDPDSTYWPLGSRKPHSYYW